MRRNRVARKLTDHEELAMVDYACAKQYQDLTPYLIVAQLLTIGIGIYKTEAHVWFGRETDLLSVADQ